MGEASLAFKCFLEALGSVFPALGGSQERGRKRAELIACEEQGRCREIMHFSRLAYSLLCIKHYFNIRVTMFYN